MLPYQPQFDMTRLNALRGMISPPMFGGQPPMHVGGFPQPNPGQIWGGQPPMSQQFPMQPQQPQLTQGAPVSPVPGLPGQQFQNLNALRSLGGMRF